MAREPFIAWRNRHDPAGLQPYDADTGRNGTLIQSIGFSLGRWWFFGLSKYRFAESRDAVAQMPEMIVVADGRTGARMLKQIRNLDHVSIYWPGRGEIYLHGGTFGRVTIDSAALPRLTYEEIETLRSRTQTWGDRAIWLEL